MVRSLFDGHLYSAVLLKLITLNDGQQRQSIIIAIAVANYNTGFWPEWVVKIAAGGPRAPMTTAKNVTTIGAGPDF
jgi:hypothetical protein